MSHSGFWCTQLMWAFHSLETVCQFPTVTRHRRHSDRWSCLLEAISAHRDLPTRTHTRACTADRQPNLLSNGFRLVTAVLPGCYNSSSLWRGTVQERRVQYFLSARAQSSLRSNFVPNNIPAILLLNTQFNLTRWSSTLDLIVSLLVLSKICGDGKIK